MKNFILINLICLLLFACAKEKVAFVDAPIKPANCEFWFEFDDNITALDSSLDAIQYSSTSALTFVDERGEFHTFNIKRRGSSISCFHEWTCLADTSIKKTYWERRTLFNKILTAESHEIEFTLSSYAALNENFPQKRADVLNIDIFLEDKYHRTILNYVVDQRNDETATNEHLKFSIVKEIDGVIFKNVYENTVDIFTVYFNTEFGFLGYRNNKTRHGLTLVP